MTVAAPTVRGLAKLVGEEHMRFGRNVIIDDFAVLVASAAHPVTIGDYVHITCHVSIVGGPVTLESFTNIGAASCLVAGSDDFMGHLIGPTVPAKFREVTRTGIIMRKHSVLGARCVVLPGVELAEGSAVGAGSVVTASTEPWCIYVGSPARKVGIRDKWRILVLEALLRKQETLP